MSGDDGDAGDATPTGFRLTSRQQRQLEQRMKLRGMSLVQPPGPEDARTVRANQLHGPVGGIPFDVALNLEALRQLAEQGNKVAEHIYRVERIRLGLE